MEKPQSNLKRWAQDFMAAVLFIAAFLLPGLGLMAFMGEGPLFNLLSLQGLESLIALVLALVCAFAAFRIYRRIGYGQATIEMDLNGRYRLPIALLLLLASGMSCTGGFAQLLGEGPHSPDGGVTWAPGTPLRFLLLVLLGICLLVFSVRMMARPKPKK